MWAVALLYAPVYRCVLWLYNTHRLCEAGTVLPCLAALQYSVRHCLRFSFNEWILALRGQAQWTKQQICRWSDGTPAGGRMRAHASARAGERSVQPSYYCSRLSLSPLSAHCKSVGRDAAPIHRPKSGEQGDRCTKSQGQRAYARPRAFATTVRPALRSLPLPRDGTGRSS